MWGEEARAPPPWDLCCDYELMEKRPPGDFLAFITLGFTGT